MYLAYIHSGIFDDQHVEYLDGSVTQYIRRHYQGLVIAAGGYDAQSGARAIKEGDADLVAYGRNFIANPDYVLRLKANQPILDYDESMLKSLD